MNYKLISILNYIFISLSFIFFFVLYILGFNKTSLEVYLPFFFVTLSLSLIEISFSYYNYSYFFKRHSIKIDKAKKEAKYIISEVVFNLITNVLFIVKFAVILFLSMFYYYIFHNEFSLLLKIALPIMLTFIFALELIMSLKAYKNYKQVKIDNKGEEEAKV